MKFANNAFSTKMVGDCIIMQTEISEEEFCEVCRSKDVVNCIGHPDTAEMFGVEMTRKTIHLKDGDILFVCEMNNESGTRLPEGITRMSELPEGVWFRFLKIEAFEIKAKSLLKLVIKLLI